jgi:hypothetical protein
MFNFLLLTGQVALVVISTWKADQIRQACQRLSEPSSRSPRLPFALARRLKT